MSEKSYGKYIRDDGDALLRAYVESGKKESPKKGQKTEHTKEPAEEKTGTFAETSSRKSRNYSKSFIPSTEYLSGVNLLRKIT